MVFGLEMVERLGKAVLMVEPEAVPGVVGSPHLVALGVKSVCRQWLQQHWEGETGAFKLEDSGNKQQRLTFL